MFYLKDSKSLNFWKHTERTCAISIFTISFVLALKVALDLQKHNSYLPCYYLNLFPLSFLSFAEIFHPPALSDVGVLRNLLSVEMPSSFHPSPVPAMTKQNCYTKSETRKLHGKSAAAFSSAICLQNINIWIKTKKAYVLQGFFLNLKFQVLYFNVIQGSLGFLFSLHCLQV